MPETEPATTLAVDAYQQTSSPIRTWAKIMGWVHIAANIYLIYAIVVALSVMFADRRLREPDALGVLLTINGCVFIIGIFFEMIFLLGTCFGDIDDLNLYTMFAVFSIAFHLNALFAFLLLEVWMFVGLSVIPLVLHTAGLFFVAAVYVDIKEVEKRLIQQIRQNQQQQLPGPPPPYSS